MSCVNMTELLRDARSRGFGVGAFNVLDYLSMRAVVRTAEELSAPVIVQTSVKTVLLWGYAAIRSWYLELARDSSVPIVLHLDHCKDLEVIRRCIAEGWTSVMIDASSKPFEENLAATRDVVAMAHPKGISVEAELGEIGGVEEDVKSAGNEARLADPEKALRFCKSVAIDALAPAIGTAHGIYKGEPRIAFDRLQAIARGTGLPLALHGGTGLSEEVFKRCIALGCAKVNISTMLKHTLIDSFLEYHGSHAAEYEPLKAFTHQLERLATDVRGMIRLFGSEGRAGGAAAVRGPVESPPSVGPGSSSVGGPA